MPWPLDRRRSLLVAAVAAAVISLLILYLLGTILLTLGLSVVLAFILLGPVRLIERAMPWRERRPALSRKLAIGIIYAIAIAAIAGTLALLIPAIVEDSQRFAQELPDLFARVRASLEDLIGRYADEIPENVKDRIQEFLDSAGGLIGNVALDFVQGTFSTLASSFSIILGLAATPVMVYGLLKDSERIRDGLFAPFPTDLKPYVRELFGIAGGTLGSYIRGQLTLGLIIGVIVGVSLKLMGVPYAFVLGLAAGLTQLVPIVGPWIGALFGLLVTLAVAPEKLLWVALFYVGVQLFSNMFIEGRVQSNALRIHPVWLTVIIVVAGKYFGIWGIIIGPPIVAIIRDIAVWLSNEWNREEGASDEAQECT